MKPRGSIKEHERDSWRKIVEAKGKVGDKEDVVNNDSYAGSLRTIS